MSIGTQQPSSGFTIIEVLIVIAIGGSLLISAILLLNGDTTNSSFVVAINDFKQQIEQTINETSSGYYPYQTPSSCQGNPTGQPTFVGPSQNQGENFGCIFLGKVMDFAPIGANQFSVYSVAGDQNITVAGNTESPGTLPAANPITIPGETAGYLFKSGLTVYKMTAGAGGATTTNSVGFLAGNIASYTSGASPALISGAEPLSLYYDTGVGSNLDSDFQAGYFVPTTEVDICIDGGNNKSGLIQIGGTGNGSLTVALTIKDGNIC